jgi:hypothetical protein
VTGLDRDAREEFDLLLDAPFEWETLTPDEAVVAEEMALFQQAHRTLNAGG